MSVAAERFLAAESWTEVIDEILGQLGTAAEVSRVYVFENRRTDDQRVVSDQRAEWVAPGVSVQLGNPVLQGFDYGADGYGEWAARMSQGEAVQGHLDEVGPRQRELFAEQDILSLLMVPVSTDAGWWGFLGFDDCVEGRRFPAVEVEALRAAASILGAALHRERAQRELSEAEARYRTLVEQIPAAIHISRLDVNASTIYISPQIEQLFGYTPQEWIANPRLWSELLHEDDRESVLAANEGFVRTGEPFRMTYRMHARDGRTLWIRDEAVMIRDADGAPVSMQGLLMDVSETRKVEEDLQHSLALLEHGDAERRELLAHLVSAQEQERVRIASDIHDDPLQKLTAVGMRLGGLRRELGESAPEMVLQLERTISGAIASLRNLLFEVRPPSLDREGIAIALAQYLREGATPEAELTWELDDRLTVEPPPEVRAICYRICQEAITNVRKHARATHLKVELGDDGDSFRVRIHDDGIGIRTDDPGTGIGHLGIPSMRERAGLAGGRLDIRARPGGGTTVEVVIPIAGPSAAGSVGATTP
ncbi:MAG: PAS domain-containing protein [Actinomycetota bacterium]